MTYLFSGCALGIAFYKKVYTCASCASRGARGRFKMAKLEALSRWHHAVLHLSRSHITKWSKSFGCWCSSRFLSPLSCHLSSFCWAAVFHTSGLVLPSSSILWVLNLDLHHNIEGAHAKEVRKLLYSGKIWWSLKLAKWLYFVGEI